MGLPSINLAYSDVVEQFVNDASFLWVLRSVAVNQPHYNVADMRDLEQRIQEQLDGLSVEPQIAWDLIVQALDFNEAGEVFTAAVFAFRSMEVERIKYTVSAGLINQNTMAGLISALAWLPLKLVEAWLHKFYMSKDMAHKEIALAVSRARRENPGEKLDRIFSREDCMAISSLRIQALRAAADLKRVDLVNSVSTSLEHEDDSVRFWAIYASNLLGSRQHILLLEPYVLTENPLQTRAIQLAFRVLPIDLARSWIGKLVEDSTQTRSAIKAMAVLGDPEAVPWMINLMRQAEYARIAAEAFTLITGIDLDSHDLTIDVPDIDGVLPDELDEGVDLDEDENLDWPNVDKIMATWQKYGGRFQGAKRFLMGKEVCPENMVFFEKQVCPDRAIREPGYLYGQRQRQAAAFEVALSSLDTSFLNVESKVLEL